MSVVLSQKAFFQPSPQLLWKEFVSFFFFMRLSCADSPQNPPLHQGESESWSEAVLTIGTVRGGQRWLCSGTCPVVIWQTPEMAMPQLLWSVPVLNHPQGEQCFSPYPFGFPSRRSVAQQLVLSAWEAPVSLQCQASRVCPPPALLPSSEDCSGRALATTHFFVRPGPWPSKLASR